MNYNYITNNRKSLEEHLICACVDCLSEYNVNKICDWIDDAQTAICPYCWDDTVLVSPNYTNLYTIDDVIKFHREIKPYDTNDQIIFTDSETRSIYF
jgi:hypothetical protein